MINPTCYLDEYIKNLTEPWYQENKYTICHALQNFISFTC